MPEEYDLTTTENLTQVIDALQLGRKTGVLTVERGEGHSLQRGLVIFVNGQPVRSQLGNLNTAVSLEWLATWQACRFAFLPNIPPDLMEPPPSVGVDQGPPSRPLPSIRQFSPALPADPGGYRAPYRGENNVGRQLDPMTFVRVVPYRLQQVDEILYIMNQRGFARIHRRLLLLIDGSRTIKDLAVLLGRNPEDVAELLHQMKMAGLIYY